MGQEVGAIVRALKQGSCILVLTLMLCPFLVTELTVGTQLMLAKMQCRQVRAQVQTHLWTLRNPNGTCIQAE